MSEVRIKNFKRVLVANRGEIAIRVFRALNELGITSVAVYSKEDKYAMFRTLADEAYPLNPEKGPIDAYLDIPTILKIAKDHNVDAIHPGYGFLAENPVLVEECEKNGITFIGPTVDSMNAMGDKISSKQIAIASQVPIIPGVDHAMKTVEEAMEVAKKVGYPVMLKASNGGGGRGMRIVSREEDMPKEFKEAIDESKKAFGDDQVFIEKYLKGPKHVEVQVLADNYGNVVHLFDRDCSVQRRHQKVVEYAPAFSVPEASRQKIFDSAIRLCKQVGYRNAGTCEFLVDSDGNPYFIEMNPRIQVEHTVTELVTDVDIVRSQILIAEGYPLNSPEINITSQKAIECHGYAIQTRVTSEDPSNNFMPDTGKVSVYHSGSGNGIRLDGGNVYTGAEILPYYDSLLVKVCSFDRTFKGAAVKSLRALREMRIQGIKTNISFLINVINNPTFQAGACYTTFIEETPELFSLSQSPDRVSKILDFLGDKIVNVSKGEKPYFEDRVLPKYDETALVYGAKDEFKKLGAKGFTQKILGEKRLYVTDTSMRAAQQSLIATRMRTKDIVGAAKASNVIFQNAFSVEAWGGATYDTAYRFLKESPWKRLEILSERMPNTLIQMLLRASNAVGYSNYPDNLVKEFIRISAIKGVDVKYTLDYYVEKAKELEAMGVHILAIKDMAGLLKPYAAQKLVETLKSELHIPVHLHTHDTTGAGVATVLKAAEAGVDIVDLAIESMSSCTSQPSLNVVVEALKGTERDTGLDFEGLDELSRYYEHVRKVYKANESGMVSPNAQIYKYEIPGGQYSNLLAQVTEMGSKDEFEKIKELYRQANILLGNLIKVTPSSKVVGDLAIFMLKNGLTKDNILTEGASLSYPDSVIDFFKGMMGQPEGGFPKELQKIVLKDIEPITVRPGTLLPDVDFEDIKHHLREKFDMKGFSDFEMEQKAVSYALYPKVYEDYCTHFEAYNDVTTLESHVYFYGLRKGEETVLKASEGRDILIKFVGMSDPDKEGYRVLTFEVNGILRELKVLDKTLEVLEDRKLKADKNNPCHLGSTIPGTVETVLVKEGDEVKVNQPLMIVEAMKMETTFVSKVNGKVDKLYVAPGDRVNTEDLLVSFILDEEE